MDSAAGAVSEFCPSHAHNGLACTRTGSTRTRRTTARSALLPERASKQHGMVRIPAEKSPKDQHHVQLLEPR